MTMPSTVVKDLAEQLAQQHREGQRPLVGEFKHWQHRRDADDVLWVEFDRQGTTTNTLCTEVLTEFNTILQHIEEQPPTLVAIYSAKASGFCAGADIKQFTEASQSDMSEMLRQGHGILDRLENLSVPTLAIIHGHCLGGGLELALACQRRIGIIGIESGVKYTLEMGFPEIRLGLHPGLGGTRRLTRLIDPNVAMSLMLTGKSIYGTATKQQGLVDELIEWRHLGNAVKAKLRQKFTRQSATLRQRLFSTAPGRKLAAKRMRALSQQQAPHEHYPAPFALIELWETFGGDPEAMQTAEQESFVKLVATDTARNLIRVFFLQQALKLLAGKSRPIQNVHVIGAGAMGGDIAAFCAMQGLRVTLSDQKLEPIANAVHQARRLCQRKHRSAIQTRETLDRLIPDPDNHGIASADLIIEAVPENLEVKRALYALIEPRMQDSAILATNTSSIPLDQLAESLRKPERFLGLHFFNPVSEMLVVEVVRHASARGETDASALQSALALTGAIGKLPISVASYPGFLVNRALTPYLLEAVTMLDEKIDKQRIDQVALNFGMPMGPLALADQIGLDVCLHVADMLAASLSQPMAAVPDWLRQKVTRGELGKKTGEGFYHWTQGKVSNKGKKQDRHNGQHAGTEANQEIQDRLILPMLNACVECHRNGVVSDLAQLDAAMVFGAGFAPFRGGPVHYARSVGIDRIVERLTQLQEKFGDRFTPDPGWKDVGRL